MIRQNKKDFCFWRYTLPTIFSYWLLISSACGSTASENKPVEQLPTTPGPVVYKFALGEREPIFDGRKLSECLQKQNEKHLTFKKLLTLKPKITGEEPDLATFELPISYDALTNFGDLKLWIKTKSGEFTDCDLQECDRATNGNCLLIWNTTYEPPGKHQIQARLSIWKSGDRPLAFDSYFEVWGPVRSFYSSNVCQFYESSSMFDSNSAILYAKLREKIATYSIELKTPDGQHIKTLKGSTTNGVINLEWNLLDEHGNKFTNDSINAVYNVTFPDQQPPITRKNKVKD